MIISLADDILEKLEVNSITSDEITSLTSLAISRKRGLNFVIGSRRLIEYLVNYERLGDEIRSIFRLIYNDQTKWNRLLINMNFCVTLTSSVSESYSSNLNDKISLNVPLCRFLDYSIDSKPAIITENINDAKFYELIIKSYTKYKNINGVNLVYKRLNGGGDTTYEVLLDQFNSHDGVSLCVLDSDIVMPGASVGDTAKKVIDTMPSSEYSRRFIIKSREIENIIPFSILDELFANNQSTLSKIENYRKLRILVKDGESPIKYVDIKKGLKLALSLCHGCNLSKAYWTSVLTDTNLIRVCSVNEESCSTIKSCKCKILDGFGSDLLKHCVKHIQDNGFDYSNIDSDTYDEWELICENVLPYMISPFAKSA